MQTMRLTHICVHANNCTRLFCNSNLLSWPECTHLLQRWVKDKRVSANVWTDVPRMQTRTGGDYVVRRLA